MNAILIIPFTLTTILGIYLLRKTWISNPSIGFLAFNWLMGAGIFYLAEDHITADRTHMIIVCISPVLVSLGAFSVNFLLNIENKYRLFWQQPIISEPKSTISSSKFFLIISVIITVLYYHAVGYNLLIPTLTGNVDDFTTMRLQAYAGDNYFAPGYVNQFKNTILPITFFFFCFKLRNHPLRTHFIIIGFLFLLYALLGTGQRTFLITAFLIFLACVIAVKRGKINPTLLLIPAIAVIILFIFQSIQLGRTSDGSIAEGFSALLHRIFSSNQFSALIGFRYIYTEETQSGAEWLQSLAGILPGVKGSDIANKIHFILFRSDRGTAPLSIWGSIYYNFGFLGILVFGILIGAIYQLFYYRLVSRELTIYRALCYSSLFVYFSIWIAGSPVQLLNNGVAAILMLLLANKIRIRRK